VTLRWKVVLYLVLLHAAVAALAAYFLRENRIWLLAVEAFLVVSVVTGVKIFQSIFVPLQLIRTGIQFISDSDFTTRFREVGQPELDELTKVYNRMIDNLREERVRVQEQHHFLSQIIEATPSGILIFDFDGRISAANPSAERMLQARAGDLAGKGLSEIGTPFASALSALETGESQVIPLEGIRRVKCHKSRFMDRGFPRNFLMMEELTEELRRTERAAYEKIIRMMSHEINNSVGASNSLLQSCLNYKGQLREEDRQDFETALQVAMSRNQHLNAFMTSYADVIRLPRPDLRPCDVRQLLEDIAVLMSAECRERRIAWNWEMEEEPGLIPVDKNQMEQVFVNILRNSIEAIGENGAITIRMGKRSGRSYVEVEDTGRGISPEVRANLFTPFYSTKENGRGIGLTIVQEILTQHRFHFSLESQPGSPTQFTIWFH
jgi:two-component system nitrogen regulation sensor histidine kinase NtrY